MVNQRMLARRLMAVLMSSALAAQGCATTRGISAATGRPGEGRVTDRAVLAEYVQTLPPGSAVRVERATGGVLRGTLMKATGHSLIIQPRTRVPEPAVEVALSEVLSVVPDPNNGASLGKAIGIGAAAGAGAALAVFLIILAAFAD